MLQKVLVTLLMAGLTVVAAADTVYKWSDSRGQIHYTDLPPDQSDAKILGVYQNDTAGLDDDSGGDEGDGNDNGDDNGPTTLPSGNDNDQQTVDNAAVAAVNADVARSKNKQCKDAQDRYQRYIESRRLFRETSDGKREYLTDQQLNDARVKAKQSVDESCG